ncbi:hypothetical protein L6164_003538 [Bauhinia variegata]|uniref:Uncharacterized protein n=1 Tax=Bauhinia variegata TaxID=167791 RepID=A0ACB9Q4A6_BAUVA|nr:hypothetical protein L6164_003538 [Bauhinia variegata]
MTAGSYTDCRRSGSPTASSATPTSLSFSSSIFHSSSAQTHKFLSTFRPNSPYVSSKPLSISSQLATLPELSFTGEKIGETYLDLKAAPAETARAVVHRAIITDLQNKRQGTASTLTRAEVSGGGRKPCPQKKTGRARRGSIGLRFDLVEALYLGQSREIGALRLTGRRRDWQFPQLCPVQQ